MSCFTKRTDARFYLVHDVNVKLNVHLMNMIRY